MTVLSTSPAALRPTGAARHDPIMIARMHAYGRRLRLSEDGFNGPVPGDCEGCAMHAR